MIPSESASSSADASSGNSTGPVGFGNVIFGSNPASATAVSVGGSSVSYLALAIVAAAIFFFWRKN